MLQSLDPNDTTPTLFSSGKIGGDQDDKDDSTKQWLRIASGIDDMARALIRYCLAIAAQEVVDKSREWVALAEAVSEEDDIDIRTVQSITEDVNALVSENPDDSERAKIEDMLRDWKHSPISLVHCLHTYEGS